MEASRLEIQWKKICDQEKRSKERNRELLKEFERVEQHASMLAVKTDRLKSYKVLLSGTWEQIHQFGLVKETKLIRGVRDNFGMAKG